MFKVSYPKYDYAQIYAPIASCSEENSNSPPLPPPGARFLPRINAPKNKVSRSTSYAATYAQATRRHPRTASNAACIHKLSNRVTRSHGDP